MSGIADNFRGLPIEDLIVSPLIGMAKGQAALNDVTWKYIKEVAFEDTDTPTKDGKGKKVKSRSLEVELNRYVAGDDGVLIPQKINSEIPLLPLVPIPALAITKADINFTMEVKQSTKSTSSTNTKSNVSANASGGFWGQKYSVSVSGEVATARENTRSTDNSAKYEVSVHAEQLPPTEGMLKLSDMLNTLMDPVVVTNPTAVKAAGATTPTNP
jgi:hypothetical protein